MRRQLQFSTRLVLIVLCGAAAAGCQSDLTDRMPAGIDPLGMLDAQIPDMPVPQLPPDQPIADAQPPVDPLAKPPSADDVPDLLPGASDPIADATPPAGDDGLGLPPTGLPPTGVFPDDPGTAPNEKPVAKPPANVPSASEPVIDVDPDLPTTVEKPPVEKPTILDVPDTRPTRRVSPLANRILPGRGPSRTGGGMPPPPPPPNWDESRDRAINRTDPTPEREPEPTPVPPPADTERPWETTPVTPPRGAGGDAGELLPGLPAAEPDKPTTTPPAGGDLLPGLPPTAAEAASTAPGVADEPAPPAGDEPFDPWSDGPKQPVKPPSDVPAPKQPDAGAGDLPPPADEPAADKPSSDEPFDPWNDGGAAKAEPSIDLPGTPGAKPRVGFVSKTANGRAMEQATRLMDKPGDPSIEGYPAEVIPHAAADVALANGDKPAVLLFHDDGSKESDLLAAELLPILVAYIGKVDFIPLDMSVGARRTPAEERIVADRLGRDRLAPVTVVVGRERSELLMARFGRFGAADLDRALLRATKRDAPVLPPEGTTGSPDGDAAAGSPDGVAAGTPDGEPDLSDRDTGFTFTAPDALEANTHAEKLRASPGKADLPGYPTNLVERAAPKTALEPGHRPVVIVFYDNSSRASDLQAADILPVLVDHKEEIDVVLIDMNRTAERSDEEQRVVKPYYPGSVPATVVLSARRAPVKLWFQRTSGNALEAAILDASRKR